MQDAEKRDAIRKIFRRPDMADLSTNAIRKLTGFSETLITEIRLELDVFPPKVRTLGGQFVRGPKRGQHVGALSRIANPNRRPN